jgi:RNA polymerase sigma factor (sigma-70 family)
MDITRPHDQPSSLPLEGWTRLLAEGDESAWRWFHEGYYLSLLRYAAHSCGNVSAASDIVQQAYLRIARHAKPFTEESDFWKWQCCIVRCVALDHVRHITRRSALMEKFAHWRASQSQDEAAWHPSNNYSHSLTDEALAKLPAEDAALLREKYCNGNTTDELATALGITSKAVEHRLARLREQLREIILRIQ